MINTPFILLHKVEKEIYAATKSRDMSGASHDFFHEDQTFEKSLLFSLPLKFTLDYKKFSFINISCYWSMLVNILFYQKREVKSDIKY